VGGEIFTFEVPNALVGYWRDLAGTGAYTRPVDSIVELPLSLPCLRAARVTTQVLHTKMKEHFGVGRVEQGHSEWWGRGSVWRSRPGCILVKQPGDVHRDIARDGPTTFTSITLPADEVARVQGEGKVVTIAQLEADDERAAPFHRLVDAVQAGEDRLALEVATVEAVSALLVISSAQSDYSRPVRRALEHLRDRFDEPVTLELLSDYAGLDKFHLCRAFRLQVGMPPHKYLMHLRIARAKQHLLCGMRASEVAPLVGFYDQAQFTRHFRRIIGTSPARWQSLTRC